MVIDVGLVKRPRVVIEVGPLVTAQSLRGVGQCDEIKEVEEFLEKRVPRRILVGVVVVNRDIDQTEPQEGVRHAQNHFNPGKRGRHNNGCQNPQQTQERGQMQEEF